MTTTKDRATSDPAVRQHVLDRIKDENVDFLLLWFTDLEGHLKSFAVTPSEMEAALNDGMGFDGSSITGFNAIEESDMVAIPDPSTFQLMPSHEGDRSKVARMICDVVTPDGEPYEGDPRHVLRLALERMRAMGFDTFNVGPELEYFLFKSTDAPETLDEGGYFAQTTLDAATELRQETIHALESMGIPVEYAHHEVGPSPPESDGPYADPPHLAHPYPWEDGLCVCFPSLKPAPGLCRNPGRFPTACGGKRSAWARWHVPYRPVFSASRPRSACRRSAASYPRPACRPESGCRRLPPAR